MIQPMSKYIYKSEYDYEIPEELIAKFPTKNRVDSKLLSYSGHHPKREHPSKHRERLLQPQAVTTHQDWVNLCLSAQMRTL